MPGDDGEPPPDGGEHDEGGNEPHVVDLATNADDGNDAYANDGNGTNANDGNENGGASLTADSHNTPDDGTGIRKGAVSQTKSKFNNRAENARKELEDSLRNRQESQRRKEEQAGRYLSSRRQGVTVFPRRAGGKTKRGKTPKSQGPKGKTKTRYFTGV